MKSSSLRPAELGAIATLATIAIAVVVGFSYGLELSVLLLAASALGLVIALLWASVRNLTGETPLTLDEALMLGAPTAEEEQKRAVLRALKDLEFERSVGKISEADYQAYSARYREEARRLIERVDASLGQARELAEKLLTERVQVSNLDDLEKPRGDQAPDEEQEPKAPESERSKGKDTAPVDDDDNDDDDSDDDDSDDDDSDEKLTKSQPRKPVADAKATRSKSAACSSCGRSNDADSKFCKHCGAAIDAPARSARKAREREEKTR
ncbi:MAG TPA: zinc ribbon domain-containing protein [Polyangiaceae bacterium]|nr:zinc ribbon domain-containing protein [Polyangiaceae bacterium]